jgi:hypothetical protein
LLFFLVATEVVLSLKLGYKLGFATSFPPKFPDKTTLGLINKLKYQFGDII